MPSTASWRARHRVVLTYRDTHVASQHWLALRHSAQLSLASACFAAKPNLSLSTVIAVPGPWASAESCSKTCTGLISLFQIGGGLLLRHQDISILSSSVLNKAEMKRCLRTDSPFIFQRCVLMSDSPSKKGPAEGKGSRSSTQIQ